MSDIVGQIALELGLESADFKKQLMNVCNREGNTAAQSLTSTFTKTFSKIGTVMTAAISVGKIVEFGKKCIESAAGVNAANSQLEQTFGSLQDKAETAMKAVAKESGIVETRLQGVGTSIYAFAKTSGMDSQTALSMMQEALQVTADSAAYYDRSLEDTAESLKSFLKGNYANDAALGISCTETTRNAAANKLYGKSFQQLSEAQKQLTLLQMVKDANRLSGALGQAARESDGWENVTGNLTESFKQLFAVIGQPILAMTTNAVKSLTSAIQSLTVYAKSAVKTVSEMFGLKINDDINTSVNAISDISESADNGTESINDTTNAVKKLKKATAGFDQLNILSSDKSDNTGTDTAQTETALSVPIDTSSAESSVKEVESIFDKLKRKIDSLFKNTGLAKFLDESKQKINGFVSEVWGNLQSGFNSAVGFVNNIFSAFTSSADGMKEQTLQAFFSLFDGIVEFIGSVSVIWSDGLATWFANLDEWSAENYDLIKTTFDDIQQIFNDVFTFIGDIFRDTGDILLDWWKKDGKKMWDSICRVVTDLGTIFLKIFNQWIMPVWNTFIKILRSAWESCIKPIFEKLMHTVSKLWNDIIEPLWKNVLKPLVDWVIDEATPHIQNSLNIIGSIFQTVFDTVRGVINGALDALGGLIDFISGVFTGDWEKAWKGIGDFIIGIWDLIWSQIKGTINLIIDGINTLWSSIYYAVRGIVDGVGEIAGALGDLLGQDWHFNMPEYPPLIPKLAKGGLATAPTLALVGDNKNAKSDPEVIAPLSKLKQMIVPPTIKALSGNGNYNSESSVKEKSSNNSEILVMLNKMYELVKNQENSYINNIYLDSEKIESKAVKVRKRKARRYNSV